MLNQIVFNQVHTSKLDDVLDRSNNIIYRCSSIFPFELFPDTLVIKEDEIDITNKQFFGTEQTYTILIRDILEVEMEQTPFAAAINITRTYLRTPPEVYTITNLHTNQARKALGIIRTLMDIEKHKVDLSNYSFNEVKQRLLNLSDIKY